MGVVYMAEHPVIGRKVAIKVLHVALAKDPDIVARFFNEARAIHMIAHENIVEILDFGQTPDGQPYFIMEYLTGEALSERVARGPMAVDEVVAIAEQMCRALSAAHAKGIVHRDLKPHNVQILSKASGQLVVKILDFGVAKILAAPDGSQSVKTRTGSLMGTPLYMSPEQCKGAGLLDHRTDIYSLGVMIFEMIAGRPPFVAEGMGELFAKHMLEEAPSVTEFAPHTPPNLAAALAKSLQKRLEDRFADMEEFRKALTGEIRVAAPGASATRPPSAKTPGPLTSTQMLPEAQSTTLSAATSEIDEDLAPPRRRTGLIVGVVGALAAAAAVVFFVLPKGNGTGTGGPTAGTGTTVKPTTGTGAALNPPPPPPPPALPKTVTIRLEAMPIGAHVIRRSDDKDLGPAPVEVKLPRNGDPTEFAFRLDGYKEKSLVAELSTDRTLRVALDKAPPPPPVHPPNPPGEGGHHRPTGGGHHPAGNGHHRPGTIDEDGLATPSF
jgi:serine/threonine-protein kinase